MPPLSPFWTSRTLLSLASFTLDVEMPDDEGGLPNTTAWYILSTVRPLNWLCRRSRTSGDLARIRQPDVSLSRRCTRCTLLACVLDTHLRALSNIVSGSPLGVATERRPAGLFTTIRCLSSYRTSGSGIPPFFDGPSTSVRDSVSTADPADTSCLALEAFLPSTVTRPWSIILLRELRFASGCSKDRISIRKPSSSATILGFATALPRAEGHQV